MINVLFSKDIYSGIDLLFLFLIWNFSPFSINISYTDLNSKSFMIVIIAISNNNQIYQNHKERHRLSALLIVPLNFE